MCTLQLNMQKLLDIQQGMRDNSGPVLSTAALKQSMRTKGSSPWGAVGGGGAAGDGASQGQPPPGRGVHDQQACSTVMCCSTQRQSSSCTCGWLPLE